MDFEGLQVTIHCVNTPSGTELLISSVLSVTCMAHKDVVKGIFIVESLLEVFRPVLWQNEAR